MLRVLHQIAPRQYDRFESTTNKPHQISHTKQSTIIMARSLLFKKDVMNTLTVLVLHVLVFIAFFDSTITTTHALPVDNIINRGRGVVGLLRTTSSRQRQDINKFLKRRPGRRIWGQHQQQQQKHQRGSSLFLSSDNSDKLSGLLFTRNQFILLFVVATPILLELYSRIGSLFIPNNINNNDMNKNTISRFIPPPSSTTTKGGSWKDVEHVTIVFHGAGGEDENTDKLMKQLKKQSNINNNINKNSNAYYNHIVDWSKYSTNILQASYNGQRIGKIVAQELLTNQDSATMNNLKSIHFIGISVGAFAADSAVNEVNKIRKAETTRRKEDNKPPFVQLTLLDPFQQRGIFGINYGINSFGGIKADYTQQYLNTDDPVPSTNKPLNLNNINICYDITNLRPGKNNSNKDEEDEIEIFGHDWPLVYYTQSENCGKIMIDNEKKKKNNSIEETTTGTLVIL
jgi:hypothetical protein